MTYNVFGGTLNPILILLHCIRDYDSALYKIRRLRLRLQGQVFPANHMATLTKQIYNNTQYKHKKSQN